MSINSGISPHYRLILHKSNWNNKVAIMRYWLCNYSRVFLKYFCCNSSVQDIFVCLYKRTRALILYRKFSQWTIWFIGDNFDKVYYITFHNDVAMERLKYNVVVILSDHDTCTLVDSGWSFFFLFFKIYFPSCGENRSQILIDETSDEICTIFTKY